MNPLDRLIPAPRLLEVDHVDLAVVPERAWEFVRHGDLVRSSITRALFALRTLPVRLAGHGDHEPAHGLRVDDLRSTAERPGFRVLIDEPPREVAVGAIGKVWQGEIPFVHVGGPAEFAAFAKPGYVKVAWSLRVEPRGERGSRVSLELRVDATDDAAWAKFLPYFRVIGPASRFIRRTELSALARDFGTPDAMEYMRTLPGDELLPDAAGGLTHFVDVKAKPDAIWPWLVQMGCGRAGYYSYDVLDNAGLRSATEVNPALQDLRVGDVIPATPEGENGFEVLKLEPGRLLVLGGLFDPVADAQRPFFSPRPEKYWHVTWAFFLEPLDEHTTRLHVRARAALSHDEGLRLAWMRPVHGLMERAQLRNLAARAEGRLPRSDYHDVLAGVGGAAVITAALLTPFLRGARAHWGLDEATAARAYPGDERVPAPRWRWTHAVEIDAPAEEVWPWVAQIGADRGGFYSYQWLENVAGCGLKNAEAVHPEWEVRAGDALRLHPDMPALPVVALERGRWFVAYAAPDERARAAGKPWVAASWLFYLEPLGPRRCRFVSRYRVACSDDLATRISFGPALVEPVGFAMDRRMLLGVKDRVERAARARRAVHAVRDAARHG